MLMGVSWARLLLLVLAAWTVVGAIGVSVSLLKKDRAKAMRDVGWIAITWGIYLAVLVAVSLSSRPRAVAEGKEQCIDRLCFTVVKAEARPSFLASHGESAVRVSIRMTNRSEDRRGDGALGAYLVDAQGRRWREVPGLGGVRLSTMLAPGESVLSEPVFRVASDATELRLVLSHGVRLAYALRMGDRDSLLHAPVFVPLEVTKP